MFYKINHTIYINDMEEFIMKKFKEYLRSFWKDEEGMEFLQLAIIIIIVAVLAIGVWGIAESVQNKLEEAGQQIESITLPSQNP